jgi:hypothetical protein
MNKVGFRCNLSSNARRYARPGNFWLRRNCSLAFELNLNQVSTGNLLLILFFHKVRIKYVIGALQERTGRTRFKKVQSSPVMALKNIPPTVTKLDTEVDLMFVTTVDRLPTNATTHFSHSVDLRFGESCCDLFEKSRAATYIGVRQQSKKGVGWRHEEVDVAGMASGVKSCYVGRLLV